MTERLKLQTKDRQIQDLDPLKIDDFIINELPTINNINDTSRLIAEVNTFIPNDKTIASFNYEEAQASIRDLGMIASSLERQGISLSEARPLESALFVLGTKIDEVPRETVFHYGVWNPINERMRTFTGTKREKVFIESFRSGMHNLNEIIYNLIQAGETSNLDDDFSFLVDSASTSFSSMVSAMVQVRKEISPYYFTNILRPYFPVLKINGVDYQAPGGAQMPVILIDRILWGLNSSNLVYNSYYLDNLKYLPSQYRILDSVIKDQSLVSKFQTELKRNGLTDVMRKSGQSLVKMFNLLLQFRFPHLKTAQENFKLRSDDANGSGGYSPTILIMLMEQTKEAKSVIEEATT